MGHHCLETLALLGQLREARSRRGRSDSAKVTTEVPTAWRSCHEPPALVWTGSNPLGVPPGATSSPSAGSREPQRGCAPVWGLLHPPWGAQGPLQLPVCTREKSMEPLPEPPGCHPPAGPPTTTLALPPGCSCPRARCLLSLSPSPLPSSCSLSIPPSIHPHSHTAVIAPCLLFTPRECGQG